ncbi:hypothetical protein HK096_000555, partial [Nowakowskiella sp. JEL0078]
DSTKKQIVTSPVLTFTGLPELIPEINLNSSMSLPLPPLPYPPTSHAPTTLLKEQFSERNSVKIKKFKFKNSIPSLSPLLITPVHSSINPVIVTHTTLLTKVILNQNQNFAPTNSDFFSPSTNFYLTCPSPYLPFTAPDLLSQSQQSPKIITPKKSKQIKTLKFACNSPSAFIFNLIFDKPNCSDNFQSNKSQCAFDPDFDNEDFDKCIIDDTPLPNWFQPRSHIE